MDAGVLQHIVGFLRDIGLRVEQRTLAADTILPGISLDDGILVFDPDRVAYPGDLLHEAGHLAVMPAAERANLGSNAGQDARDEMGAIAWSYAATVFLRLPPEIVFHDAGYKGLAGAIREAFGSGRYIGVPLLEWRGLTDFAAPGAMNSAMRYPVMKKWLCD